MTDQSEDPTAEIAEPTEDEQAAAIEAYDLNGDGKVSIIDEVRAEIGIVDAQLEELAEHPGVKGKIAKVAHEVLDKIDNDG